jgi:hypothetical protein
MMISFDAGRILTAAKVLHSPVVIMRNAEECLSSDAGIITKLPTGPRMPAKTCDTSVWLGFFICLRCEIWAER